MRTHLSQAGLCYHTWVHSLQVLGSTGFSPLPGGGLLTSLNSPYLELMSASPGSQLMAMFNQLAQRTGTTPAPGQTSDNKSPGIGSGITPGSLFTPSMWPDSTRSGGGVVGGIKNILDLDSLGVDGVDDLAEAAISNLADSVLGGKLAAVRSSAHESKSKPPPLTLPSGNTDLLPLTSPGTFGMATAAALSGINMGGMYKGVNYDKDRNLWQVRRPARKLVHAVPCTLGVRAGLLANLPACCGLAGCAVGWQDAECAE